MSTFKVGEVAIANGLVNWPELNGVECEIISPLRLGVMFDPRTDERRVGAMHDVRWPDGTETAIDIHNLRKRRPPATDESEYRQAALDCIERAKRPAMEPA